MTKEQLRMLRACEFAMRLGIHDEETCKFCQSLKAKGEECQSN